MGQENKENKIAVMCGACHEYHDREKTQKFLVEVIIGDNCHLEDAFKIRKEVVVPIRTIATTDSSGQEIEGMPVVETPTGNKKPRNVIPPHILGLMSPPPDAMPPGVGGFR